MGNSRYKWSLTFLIFCLVSVIFIIICETYKCIYDFSFWGILVIILSQIITVHELQCKKQQSCLQH